MAERRVRTEFDANTAQFDRGVQRMNRNMRRFQRGTETRLDRLDRRFRRAGQGVQTFQRAIAGLAAAAGLRRLSTAVQGAVSQLDNIAKAADRLGLTTNALQELRVAAELSGVSVQQFDLGFQRFVRRAAEAAQGSGEAQDALEELGFTIQELQSLSSEELFLRLADAMSETENATTLLRQGFKLFDSEGVVMIEMVRNGRDALERMRAKARELGLVIEDDLIRRTVALNDEMTLLERQLSTDTTEALVRLGPLIRDLGGLLVWLANRAAEAHEGFRRLFTGTLFSSEQQQLVSGLSEARAELAALDAELQRELDPATRSAETRVQIEFQRNRAMVEGEDFDEFNAVLDVFADRRAALVERVETLQQRLGSALEGEDVVTPPEMPSTSSFSGDDDDGSKNEEAVRILENLRERIELLREERKIVGRSEAVQARLTAQFEKQRIVRDLLNAASKENSTITAEQLQEALSLADAYEQQTIALSDLETRLEEKRRAEEEAIEAARRHQEEMGRVAESIFRAITSANSFEEALNRVLFAITRILQQRMSENFSSVIGDALDGVISGLFSSGGAPSTSPIPPPRPVAHRGGVIGQDSFPTRRVPDFAFAGAPRMHSGGIAGLRPNEVPAILEKGEIVVPKNIGLGRGGNNVTINEGNVSITQPGATPEQIRRIMAEERQKTIRQISEINEDDPEWLHT